MDDHVCLAECCDRLVPHRLLMCRQHWRLVPRSIQTEVYAGYADRLAGRQGGWARWRLAADLAVRAVAHAEGRAPSRPPGTLIV
jgi:hypothetical protein